MCLRGSLKCVESGEGEHPDGGPPGPRPAPGKRRRREQPAPSQDPRLCRPGPFPCALRCFLRLTRREGRGGKDPCGCPLPITNIVVKLQMAAPLPNSTHTASPNAMEMDPELASAAALSTWIPLPPRREGSGWGIPHYIVPKACSPFSPRPRQGTREE